MVDTFLVMDSGKVRGNIQGYFEGYHPFPGQSGLRIGDLLCVIYRVYTSPKLKIGTYTVVEENIGTLIK